MKHEEAGVVGLEKRRLLIAGRWGDSVDTENCFVAPRLEIHIK